MLQRIVFFAYGLVNYVVFLGVVAYSIGFIGNVLTPTAMDAVPTAAFGSALAVNAVLLLAFALQHSGMAQPAFKEAWARIVPPVIERSTYVLFTNAVMILLFVFWEPMGGIVWAVEDSTLAAVIYAVYALGWVAVVVSTFLMDHFDLFGLRQVYCHLVDEPYRSPRTDWPGLYRWVRRPLCVGWLVVFWATPTMTTGHLVFALATSVYLFVATPLEESDESGRFGDRYRGHLRRLKALTLSSRGPRDGRAAQ